MQQRARALYSMSSGTALRPASLGLALVPRAPALSFPLLWVLVRAMSESETEKAEILAFYERVQEQAKKTQERAARMRVRFERATALVSPGYPQCGPP
jgi:hypothetical protein